MKMASSPLWESQRMFTRLSRLRYLRVAGFAVAAVTVTGLAVVVTASAAGAFRSNNTSHSDEAMLTAVDSRASAAVCSDFMKHFAVEIGKTQAEINAAFQRAVADTLADEVKAGHITQARADAIKQKLANHTPCTLPSLAGHGDRHLLHTFMRQYIGAAASALGLTEAQLKTDLANGQSLSQVAGAQKVSEATFRTNLIANLKPVLDKAVADKMLSADQEQRILSRLQNGPLPMWDHAFKHRPAPTATPSAA